MTIEQTILDMGRALLKSSSDNMVQLTIVFCYVGGEYKTVYSFPRHGKAHRHHASKVIREHGLRSMGYELKVHTLTK